MALADTGDLSVMACGGESSAAMADTGDTSVMACGESSTVMADTGELSVISSGQSSVEARGKDSTAIIGDSKTAYDESIIATGGEPNLEEVELVEVNECMARSTNECKPGIFNTIIRINNDMDKD